MSEKETGADRIATYSDAFFAVIVTIMVLELKAPDEATFSALLPLWPTAISYALSYVVIGIIWMKHRHLTRFAGRATPGLIWSNFLHLFLVSLIPFATAWVARTKLGSAAMVFYAGLFICLSIAYTIFEHEILSAADPAKISGRAVRVARRQSRIVIASFAAAMVVALFAPRVAFGLMCFALILHVRPEVDFGSTGTS